LQRHIKIATWLFEFESLPLPSNDQQGDSQAIGFESLNYVSADKNEKDSKFICEKASLKHHKICKVCALYFKKNV
jgi:hypothetical protein